MLNPNDADDSDSSTDSSPPVAVPRPKRSATVSPSTRNSFYNSRRRSDANLNFFNERERQRERRRSMVRASRERSESRRASQQNLRKTNSEPNVDMPSIDVEALQKLLLSLPKFASTSRSRINHRHDSDSGGEMTTEIEELKDAAKSIQSLQRVLAYPSQTSSDRGGNRRLPTVDPVESCIESSVFSDVDESSLATDTTEGGRRSGISTRLGHPRGVMQFIPSIRNDQFVPTSEIRRNSLSRKSSVPDGFMNNELQSDPVPNVRNRRRGIVDEMFSSSTSLLVDRPSETLAGVNRFAKLLDTFRSRPTSPEQHPSISWSPYVYSDGGEALETCGMEDSLHEADILLWKKRSRASLRRHYSVRHLAARELLDTEKSFVEGLEFLVTKYMRPLRQPLECTLIEASLVDKIFYRIPEILAHHQVLLTTLSQRIEQWHKDAILGDVLLAHFSKQSMIETYIAFVDNFKFAKAAITQARQKHAFEKYYSRCCRDHPNKLDLDALLISPIQRVPRYELIVKQMLKHTPVEHEDRERLQRAQRHIHCLAVAINQHKDGSEQMEQRLREIEAIVDGLDDLVTKERTLLRHDIIILKGTDRERCIFMLSDLLLVTSVKKKAKVMYNKLT
uniref:DH domain-containing protein n=1 Tax=Caenorhabditis tropicalis TaxID=1561998 RepID=A0A1I7TMT2_9PELO